MAGHRFDSRGHTLVKKPNDFKVSLPTVFEDNVEFQGGSTSLTGSRIVAPVATGDAITVTSGTVRIENGRTILTRTSGAADTSGMLFLGGVPVNPTFNVTSSVLLTISGAAGEGNRCAINLFSSGAGAWNNQRVGVAGTSNGFGGQAGIMAPASESVMLYYNGRQLCAKTQFGEFIFVASSSVASVGPM